MFSQLSKGLFILSIVAVSACSGSESPQQSGSETNIDKKEKPAGVIPQHQLKALDKAKGVEELLQETDQDRREKMDESSQ